MYRKALFTTLLGTALLTNGVEAGRGNGSPNDPRIDATKVDSQQTLLTIQGDHFGSSMPSVVMGRWQLKVKTHSNQEIVAELPKGVSGKLLPDAGDLGRAGQCQLGTLLHDALHGQQPMSG